MGNDMKRATGLLVIEVVNSNPNGNPDADADPRQRSNGLGEISPVSLKRKLRDLVEDHESAFFKNLPEKFSGNPEAYCILESRGRDRNAIKKEMREDGKLKEFDQKEFLKSKFVQKYWDARVFGNTFLEGEMNKGYIKTGVVQIGMGISLSPINIIRQTNTSKSGVEEGKTAGMAPMAYRVVEHGVYCMPFFVNPNYAHKSGCTTDDIELLKCLIPYAYDMNRSAIRPEVRLRHAWYVEHKNVLGSCPEYLLLEALTPERCGNADEPSASWRDYQDKNGLPEELLSRVAGCVDLVKG